MDANEVDDTLCWTVDEENDGADGHALLLVLVLVGGGGHIIELVC